jgi:hypothetical protein
VSEEESPRTALLERFLPLVLRVSRDIPPDLPAAPPAPAPPTARVFLQVSSVARQRDPFRVHAVLQMYVCLPRLK